MRRRRFFATIARVSTTAAATAAVGVGTGVTGCLGLGSRPSVPDGMTVEVHYRTADVLADGLWYRRTEREESYNSYYTIIADRTAARDRIEDDEEPTDEFVRETDFERSYLLVVQYLMQSARWLELASVERTDSGLDVWVVTQSPDEPYGDDAAAHSLVVRVTDERADAPEAVTVAIDGEETDFSEAN